MANRTVDAVNLPRINRQSLPIAPLEKVQIPLMNEGAQQLVALGAITRDAGRVVGEIDRKNQEVAAERQFTDVFLQAQKAIDEYQSTASADDDITGKSLAIYNQFITDVDSKGLPSIQAEILKKKLLDRQPMIGQRALDYELKYKAEKYDQDLSATMDNAANIVASDPRLFSDQLKNVEGLIGSSRLNEVEKTAKLTSARQLMSRTYITRLAETNPAKARAELNSEAFNSMIDPQFKAAALAKLDAEAKARANIALQDDIKSIDQAKRLGVTVPKEFITSTAARARASGQEKTAASLEKYAGLQDYSLSFAQKPLAEQQFEIKELQMKARLGDMSSLDQLEAAAETYNEKLKSLKTDPWGYYTEKGVVNETDNGLLGVDSAQAASAIAARRLEQEKVRQLEGGNVTLPLLKPQEITQLSNMKDNADPKQLAATLTQLGAGMNGSERRATIAAVAAKEPLLAVAMGQDFGTATRMIAGSRAKGEVTPQAVREMTAESLKGVTIDGTLNDTFNDAIFAYYKQLALEKGEVTKVPSRELVNKAVSDVVGNIVDVNVGKPSRIIAPAGLDASQLEDRFNSLTDEVLKEQQGALPQTADGFSATASDIRQFGRFISAGDGVYAVQLPSGVLYRENGQPYTIDINRVKPESPLRRKNNALLQSRIGGANVSR